mmetsp:Transcript_14115/g.19771  ORF Transcript_14115/g.19771 Transcript_14115/m.19771 type:complete len:127 (+) Transcript_14115:1082-1462(+)
MTDWGPETNSFQLSWTPFSPAMHVLWIDAFCALHFCAIILLFPQYFGPDSKFAAGLVFATWTGDTILGYHTLLTKQRKGEIALRKITMSGKTKNSSEKAYFCFLLGKENKQEYGKHKFVPGTGCCG